MAPNLRDQLPIIKALAKWFTSGNSLVIDSLIFKLHHQVMALKLKQFELKMKQAKISFC